MRNLELGDKIIDRMNTIEDNQVHIKKHVYNNYKDMKRNAKKIAKIQENLSTINTDIESLNNKEERDYTMAVNNQLELEILKKRVKANRIVDIILIFLMTVNVIFEIIIIFGGMC